MKLWCEFHGMGNGGDVLCLAHLAEGRVLTCPYGSITERAEDPYPCSDYEPLVDTPVNPAK